MSKIIKVHSDGGSRGNPGPSAAGYVITENGKVIQKGSRYLGTRTNNEAEYFGVIIALEWLKENNSIIDSQSKIMFFLDSELVTRQITGKYRVKGENLKPLMVKVRNLIKDLGVECGFFSIPREKNKLADLLVNMEIDENYR